MHFQRRNEHLSLKQRDDMSETDCALMDPFLDIHDQQRSELLHRLQTSTEQNSNKRDDINDLKRSNNECRYTCLDEKHDGLVADLKQNEELLPSKQGMISKSSSKEKHEIPRKFPHVRLLMEKINRLQFTRHEIIMIILNILMFGILIVVFLFCSRSPMNISIDMGEILVVKRGDPYGGPGGESLWDDAEIATLTFNNTIVRITASQSVDLAGEPLLLTLNFGYSNEKLGKEFGGLGRAGTWEDLDPLELTSGERIDRITIYEGYRNITNLWRQGKLTYIIVGIRFKTDHNQEMLYGSTNGIQKEESLTNYFLGYAQGKCGGYVDSLRFTWYKYCFKNSTITDENLL